MPEPLGGAPAGLEVWSPEAGQLQVPRAVGTQTLPSLPQASLAGAPARHYEGPGAAADTPGCDVCPAPVVQPWSCRRLGSGVVAECPARWTSLVSPWRRVGWADPGAGLAGPRQTSWVPGSAAHRGWSDTPPLAYELGGAVLGLAEAVDRGRRSIGARARIPEPELRLAVGPGRTRRPEDRVLQPGRHAGLPPAPGPRSGARL